jgi:hypothetical protein
VGFLRRLLGGGTSAEPATASDPDGPTEDPDAEERARDLELLRDEQERLDDLTQRQLRYAEYAWQPPAQGGERRADDAETRDES